MCKILPRDAIVVFWPSIFLYSQSKKSKNGELLLLVAVNGGRNSFKKWSWRLHPQIFGYILERTKKIDIRIQTMRKRREYEINPGKCVCLKHIVSSNGFSLSKDAYWWGNFYLKFRNFMFHFTELESYSQNKTGV